MTRRAPPILKTPTLELGWLRRGAAKSLPVPDLLICDPAEVEYGGCFCVPRRREEQIGSGFYSLDRGLIVVATSKDHGPSVLAHEWRHLEQLHTVGLTPASPLGDAVATSAPEDYRRGVVKYFRGDWTEMDALAFEIRRFPVDYTLEWWDWLHGSQESTTPPP